MGKRRQSRSEALRAESRGGHELSRRNLLFGGLALGALAVEEATIGAIRRAVFGDGQLGGTPATSSPTPAQVRREESVEAVEQIIHEPPKIEFAEMKNPSDPELPEGIEVSEIDNIAHQLYEKLDAHFKQTGTDPESEQSSPSSVLNACAIAFQEINPAFKDFLIQRNAESDKYPYVLLSYVNQFLLRIGHYLFVDFHVSHYTSLHRVLEHGEVVIDGQRQGMFVVLDKGTSGASQLDLNAVFIPEMPNVVHLWPHQNESIIASYRESFGDEKTPAFEGALRQGLQYHEAMHLFLEGKYPRGNVPFQSFVAKEFRFENGLSLNLSGQYGPADLQELCAIGAQLSRATHPHEILMFIGNQSPGYQLASSVLALTALKYMPDSFVREDNMASLGSPATTLNLSDIFDYFKNTEDLETVHRIGEYMYNYGIEMFSAMFERR